MVVDTGTNVLDAVIVGGGLSGLTVAYRIKDQDILLLEREDVCGGRTVSREMGEYIYNTGAQVINGDDSLVAPLADELGVKRTLIKKTKIPIYMKGKLVAASSEASFLWQLPISLSDKIRLGWRMLNIKRNHRNLRKDLPDVNDPQTLLLNSVTLAEYVGARDGDLRDLWDTVALATTTTHAGESAAYHPICTLLHQMDNEYFIDGGTWQLAKKLWAQLENRIETSALVEKVIPHDGLVQVTYSKDGVNKTVTARKCVLAIPAPLVPEIVEGIPDWKLEALAAVDYGSMTSAGFLLNKPSEYFLGKGVWRVATVGSAIVSVTDPTITFSDEIKQRTGQGLLRVYTADKESKRLMQMSDGEALESLSEELYAVLPKTKGNIVTGSLKHWQHAGSPWRIGRLALVPNLQAPTGDIHYCGDYTAGSGMDGAIHSASRVLEEMGQGPLFPQVPKG